MVSNLLSQEEIDALISGVSGGEVETAGNREEQEVTVAIGGEGARLYDFTAQERIVRGRMPTLEMINERFARHLRLSLFNMLRRSADISVGAVQMSKFGEYVHSLFVPTSLNLIHIKPLRGIALVLFDPKLVFILVDNFFGGEGKFHTKIEGRDFTPTENRVIRLLLELVFKELKDAWEPVMKVAFSYLSSEVNPQFANIVGLTEVVVISPFHIDLEGGGGDFHITMPYSMLEPIRELLDVGTQSNRDDGDERFMMAFQDEVKNAKVELSATLAEATLSVREVVALREGDMISIDLPKTVMLHAEGIPVCRAFYGTSAGGKMALKVKEFIKRPVYGMTEGERLKELAETKSKEKIPEIPEKSKPKEKVPPPKIKHKLQPPTTPKE